MPSTLSEAQAAQPQVIAAPSQHKPPATADKPKRAPTISGRLKAALDLMVFGPDTGDDAGLALDWLTAARTANYSVPAMRRMLLAPHVQRYLREQRQVLRASASAQNISYAVQMRANSKNEMAKLGAMKFIEGTDEETERKAAARTPGVVIQIINNQPTIGNDKRIVDVTPSAGDE